MEAEVNDRLILLEEKVRELEEASENLRIEIRAAHEATQRLRELKKEIKSYLETEAIRIVDEAIAEAVKKGLDGYQDTIKKQTEIATNKVFERFDSLANTLLTGKKSGDGPVLGSEDFFFRARKGKRK